MAENQRTCASCGTTNEEDARFCEGCGGALGRTCGTCGVEANATARFCRACGAPLERQTGQEPDDSGPSRKTVTVMFADLAGSTTFEEQVDAETAREVMSRYHDVLRQTAQRNRAGVTKYIGDGFMAIWGVPEMGRDDAGRAVDAAVELQERFVDFAARTTELHGVELALRVAVNTGEVVVGAGDADLVGDALNVAARLEAECPRGHVVVGEETWRSTRGGHRYESLGQVQVKGRSAPVAVYRWLGRQSESTDATPFVGRGDEIRRITAALDGAVAAKAARLVTVIGDPGVGKTRLAAEFTGAQGDIQVIEARCDVEGTVALAPIVEVLHARDLEVDVPVGAPERDRILRDLNGLTAGVPGSVEETFWALRRYVEMLARDGPLVIIADDIQWADTLLLDFVEHLVEWVQDVPILVLALARPELREVRPDLVSVGRWVSEAVHLGGLDPDATAQLAAGVLGAARLPEELLTRLPSSTGGNPLFVRELVGMLVHDGVLVAEPAGWRLTIDVDAIAVPPTIHALLASRLERLNAADRRVLEIASVIGTDFSLGAVCALAQRDSPEVKQSLDRLRRLELAQPTGAYLGDEPVWRFHHVLIRDVAYRRLLKSDRANLHERLADWLETGGASGAFDSDEMTGRHLESAHGYRLELGTADEHTGELAIRSARCYLRSARRALDRDELISAGTQAARGSALAAADRAVHTELLLVGCEAFLSAGDVASGAPLVDDLDRIAGEALAPWATCYRCQFVIYTDPARLLEVDDRLQSAIDEFGRRKDPAGLAKAHRVRAAARGRLGRIGDAEMDLFEALIAARQGGDHRQITAALGAAPSAALWGPSPVPKAGGRCLDVVRMQRMTTAAPSLEATSLRCLALLELLRGRADKARSMLADARQIVADLGLRHGLMETELFAGIIESMEGDPVAAEPHFRIALEGLDALGVGADAGQAAALLARSVLAQGRIDEADRYAAESERIAGHNLKSAIAWRAVRAEILAAQGLHDQAVAIARDAVAVAVGTDLVLDHAEACLALGRVLAAAGDAKGARVARDQARGLYAAKEVASAIGQTVEPAASTALKSAPADADSTPSRLAVTNQSCEFLPRFHDAIRARDVDATLGHFSYRFVYDDRRRLSGGPIVGLAAMRAAIEHIFDQYTRFEFRVLAVRGERLHLLWSSWSDDDGNETTTLYVNETEDDGRIRYHGRFDEDDFDAAYRELEDRYYAGEGAAFAVNGLVAVNFVEAMDRLDVEAARSLAQPEFRWLASPSALISSERSIDELFRWLEERARQVSSLRNWISAIRWLSPNCSVVLSHATAVGLDGEDYEWTRYSVGEYRDRLVASVRQFDVDVDDEDAAFAYANTLVASPPPSRLAITNRASEGAAASWLTMRAGDVETLADSYADQFVYDDRRRLSGDPITDRAGMRAAFERVLEQYTVFEGDALAVRGERLALIRTRWSDDAGNETTGFFCFEADEDGRTIYAGRFDEDDFDGAYHELERRYFAGEGAPFAVNGQPIRDFVEAIDRLDVEAARRLSLPEFRWLAPPSTLTLEERSVDDAFRWLTERAHQVSSVKNFYSVVRWLSPTCVIGRGETRAFGQDGEEYVWSRIYVDEVRDGLLASVHQFDDDEAAAFAYAETLVTPPPRRLAIANRASESVDAACRALQAHDVDSAVAAHSDRILYYDRRRLSGDPIEGLAALRAASVRLLEQYGSFEWSTLAVRGDRLALARSRWTDGAGNEATYLAVFEVGGDGQITHHVRFDGHDADAAYRELEQRYYAAEGAAFAPFGHVLTEWIAAMDRLDVEVARSLAQPEFRWLALPTALLISHDHTVDELFQWLQERGRQVASVRNRITAIRWLSPNCCVGVGDARAVGLDGEDYEWMRLYVAEFRDGLIASVRQFELDDEEAAFAYAETLVTPPPRRRLAVSNRASETGEASLLAMQSHDIDAVAAIFADQFVYDDRRRLTGDPIAGMAQLRAATERILEQYSVFEARTLAVRGNRLSLAQTRWSDNAENETTHLNVIGLDDDGRIEYHGRFDGDDFGGAYRELEDRYYAGEGSAFAANGHKVVGFIDAINRLDVEVAHQVSWPDCRVLASPSMLALEERSIEDFFRWLRERATQVSSVTNWLAVAQWLSPSCLLARSEVRAVGSDGEEYAWTRPHVVEFRDGLIASVCQFDTDDEDTAVAYAETLVTPQPSLLAKVNKASQVLERAVKAMQANDAHTTTGFYAEPFTYDDRRRINGAPIDDLTGLLAAAERILAQYNRFDNRTLAVRGELLQLSWNRWADDAGNETTNLRLIEVDDDGRIVYEGRFDEDDFEGAYRELERRYYAGEGSEYAESGSGAAEYMIAKNRGDLDTLFDELSHPDMHIESRSRSLFVERSAAEYRASLEELIELVGSFREWLSAMCWLSPSWFVAHLEREAVGREGEQYEWSRIIVGEVRDRRIASLCDFEIDDEAQAFAYAEERMRAIPSRLALANRVTEVLDHLEVATYARDADAVVAAYADSFVYDDRRRLSGDPITDSAGIRAANERILEQYNAFEVRTLAVRGECLQLVWTRWSDDSGNESIYLHVFELDVDGRIAYAGRFDEDDFESAYNELERRYYAGEGSEYAEGGLVSTESIVAINQGDFDRLFDEVYAPGIRFENRSRSAFPDRTASELRNSFGALNAMVASTRMWFSAVCWLSPVCSVSRLDREAHGPDGERFVWTRLIVAEIRDRRVISSCQFELDDEDAAFEYADERMRATSSRLAVTNRATEVGDRLLAAFRARDVDAAIDAHSDQFEYDDRRRLPGDPLEGRPGLWAAHERVFEQYSVFDGRTLAVRGERLQLAWGRWSDDAGNATTSLHVFELGDDARITYHGRFEEDDFESAYRELERRYYAGEGAAFAQSGAAMTEYGIAKNRGDLDRVFGELSIPDLRVTSRSRSVFVERSAAEYRASVEELNAMVSSARECLSAIRWLSPNWFVATLEREATGRDGERYEWTRLVVGEVRDRRLASVCDFDVEDEDQAFAFAEERVRAASSRLAVINRASEVADDVTRAMQARDAVGAVGAYSDQFEYDDRRRLSGDPIEHRAGLQTALERVFEQFTNFDWRTLAVRGERLALLWSRWSDVAGNETTTLYVFELGDDALISYMGRFDEDDFEGAYRELERRYYAGEAAAFADAGGMSTEWVIAVNEGDFDRAFGELMAPGTRVENRSRSAFPDPSVSAPGASYSELKASVTSLRTWNSVVCWLSPDWAVVRLEREAVGDDDEMYTWTWLCVCGLRDGRTMSSCLFDPEDEAAAFAYAEECMWAVSSRLAVANRASEGVEAGWLAIQARDVDGLVAVYADRFEYDDRRRLSGDTIDSGAAMRAAIERILEQYPHVDWRTLAVRGERLELHWSRWWDDAGNETTYLHVFEVGTDGRIVYDGRFDEDDFESAYRELERRYYAGEGAASAEAGATQTNWITALNRGDLDRVGELYAPEMRVENRSRTGFPDRSASDLRASFAELNELVASTRTWPSAVCWVSPGWNVTRLEREAVGAGGERYEWTRLLVNQFRDGLVMFSCEFELDDEKAAFAYAEERARTAAAD